MNINHKIAAELKVKIEQVEAAVTLLDSGATVPFISRYRKEVTQGLSDTELRDLEERLAYLRELNDRQQTVLKSITEQNKLTPELEKNILATETQSALEHLYLPFKPKRRTRAQIAREAGLEPLAMQLLSDPHQHPETLAQQFIQIDKNILTTADALDGARHILMEQFAENPHLLGYFSHYLWEHIEIKSEVKKNKETEGQKFSDYFTYTEAIKKVPSHRALALFRGQQEDILRVYLQLEDVKVEQCLQKIAQQFHIEAKGRPADNWLMETVNYTWRIKIFLKLEIELLTQLREQAELEAIKVFANNLKHLLMAAPAGSRVTMGLDPGLRTGVKAVVIDKTGKLLAHTTIFPHAPKNDWQPAITALVKLIEQYQVELISIGNGTASRETDKLVAELKKQHSNITFTSVMVSEAGASVYSASQLAADEFPDLDVTYRGAVSIARRLQDPLAELIKIDPKSIGVGQYQHDVNQIKLSRSLQRVMEDCVNAVGVDLNTASVPLLSCVSGLNETVVSNIVKFRDEHGQFKNRQQLKKVARLGDKIFEQAAAFLRIVNGDNPLDASAVHPEAYSIVERILLKQDKNFKEVMGNTALIASLNAANFTDAHFGLPTVIDIFRELEKPGRDPRPTFKTAVFKEDINHIEDLQAGMILEGAITNVTNFGAFVDIGVHQDGLVHISMLANHFVKNANDVVKVGDIVQVKVLEVDKNRKRIQLTMRLTEEVPLASAPNKPAQSTMKRSTETLKENTLGNRLIAAMSQGHKKNN